MLFRFTTADNSIPYYTLNVQWTLFGDKKVPKIKGNKFEDWSFRELSSIIPQLPALLLDNPICHKHNRKDFEKLSQPFMVDCCLQNLRVKGQSYWWSGVIPHYLILVFGNSQQCTWFLLTLYLLKSSIWGWGPSKVSSFYAGFWCNTFLDVIATRNAAFIFNRGSRMLWFMWLKWR